MIELLTLIIATVASYFGVGRFERWSRKRELLDYPNDRSSHEVPTPRGGGIVIVFVCLFAYVVSANAFSVQISWSYLIGSFVVALISWLDDIRSISFLIRFLVHSIAAGLVLFELGYWSEFNLPFTSASIDLGLLGFAITFLWIVWVINAYNFMDGIDGIAGIQAAAASAGWLAVAVLLGNSQVAFFAVAILGASIGFLLHNWPPARIFMGDVGSAFLGFTFAVLPLLIVSGQKRSIDYLPHLAVLFLWPFIFDTVITFVRRSMRGEKVWTAHRGHIYQRMVISGYSHSFVSRFYGSIGSLIIAAVVSTLVFGGWFGFFTVVITVASTVLLVIVGESKKRLT